MLVCWGLERNCGCVEWGYPFERQDARDGICKRGSLTLSVRTETNSRIAILPA